MIRCSRDAYTMSYGCNISNTYISFHVSIWHNRDNSLGYECKIIAQNTDTIGYINLLPKTRVWYMYLSDCLLHNSMVAKAMWSRDM